MASPRRWSALASLLTAGAAGCVGGAPDAGDPTSSPQFYLRSHQQAVVAAPVTVHGNSADPVAAGVLEPGRYRVVAEGMVSLIGAVGTGFDMDPDGVPPSPITRGGYEYMYPDGADNARGKYGQAGPGVNVGALVGRLCHNPDDCDEPWRMIGSEETLDVAATSTLQLVVNEYWPSNNQGEFKVLVTPAVDGAQNVALGQSASQSSDYLSDGRGTADLAVDGNTNGYWNPELTITHTHPDACSEEGCAWWEVDLGAPHRIERVATHKYRGNHPDVDGGFWDRLADYDVQILDADGTVVADSHEPGASPFPDQFGFSGVVGSRVRVVLRQQNWLSLAEVEVFGTALEQQAGVVDFGDKASLVDAIQRYQPIVNLHRYEEYFPFNVEDFIRGGHLVRAVVDHYNDYDNIQIHQSMRSVSDLEQHGLYFAQQRLAKRFAQTYGDVETTADRQVLTWIEPRPGLFGHNNVYVNDFKSAVTYVEADREVEGGRTFLTLNYWYFYAYNGHGRSRICIIAHPCADRDSGPVGRHQGDWEQVRVKVDARTGEIVSLKLSSHGDLNEHLGNVSMRGQRPVVHAALDSHAFYPTPGRHTTESRHKGVVDVYVYDDVGPQAHAKVYDSTSHRLVRTNIPLLQQHFTMPEWAGFTGRWGTHERQKFTLDVNDNITGFTVYSHSQTDVGWGPDRHFDANAPVVYLQGATQLELNGTYTMLGFHNDSPYYEKADGFVLYRAGDGQWNVARDLDGTATSLTGTPADGVDWNQVHYPWLSQWDGKASVRRYRSLWLAGLAQPADPYDAHDNPFGWLAILGAADLYNGRYDFSHTAGHRAIYKNGTESHYLYQMDDGRWILIASNWDVLSSSLNPAGNPDFVSWPNGLKVRTFNLASFDNVPGE